MAIVVYHNPECGTSRNVIEMIRAAGVDPVIIEYLQTGWTRPQLLGLFASRRPDTTRGPADQQVSGRGAWIDGPRR